QRSRSTDHHASRPHGPPKRAAGDPPGHGVRSHFEFDVTRRSATQLPPNARINIEETDHGLGGGGGTNPGSGGGVNGDGEKEGETPAARAARWLARHRRR